MVNGTDRKRFNRFLYCIMMSDDWWWVAQASWKNVRNANEKINAAHNRHLHVRPYTFSEANARNIVKCHLIADDKYNVFAFI